MPTLTPDQLVLVSIALGSALTWLYMALRREQLLAPLERQAAKDDATIRAQRDQIIELHRALAGEEEASQHRDEIIDALFVDLQRATPLRVIDGGAR